MGTLLADSAYCRLCASEFEVGFTIFDDSEDKASLAILINKYLPIKVANDGHFPVRICERCHMGVAATVDLIDRMVEGQQRLRSMLQSGTVPDVLQATLINIQGDSVDIPMDDLAKGTEVAKVYAENHPMSIAVDGQPVVKKKRGRPRKGDRPVKQKVKEEESSLLDDDDVKKGRPRRSNRRANLPTRYRDSIAGRDFEKLMSESGVKEEIMEVQDDASDADYKHQGLSGPSMLEVMEKQGGLRNPKEGALGKVSEDGTSIVIAPESSEAPSDLPVSVNIEVDFQDDGNITLRGMEELDEKEKLPLASVSSVQITSMGESINMPSKAAFSEPTLFRKKRGAKKKAKWSCNICGKGFLHKGRYLLHTRLHKQVILQCEMCKDRFSTREDINIHQQDTGHTGLGKISKNIYHKKCLRLSGIYSNKFRLLGFYRHFDVLNVKVMSSSHEHQVVSESSIRQISVELQPSVTFKPSREIESSAETILAFYQVAHEFSQAESFRYSSYPVLDHLPKKNLITSQNKSEKFKEMSV
nr:uncharacterized protein LOC113807903 [Penaeus vannamei]